MLNTNTCHKQLSGKDLAFNYKKIIKDNKLKFVTPKSVKVNVANDDAYKCANFMSMYNTSKKLNSSRSKHQLFTFDVHNICISKSDNIPTISNSKTHRFSHSESPEIIFKKHHLSPISSSRRQLCSRRSLSFMDYNSNNIEEQNTSFCDKLGKSLTNKNIDTYINTSIDKISYNCVNRYKDIFLRLKQFNKNEINLKNLKSNNLEYYSNHLLNISGLQNTIINSKFKNTSAVKSHINDYTIYPKYNDYLNHSNCSKFLVSSFKYSLKIILIKTNKISDDKSTSAHLNNLTNFKTENDSGRSSPIIPFYDSKFLMFPKFSNEFEKPFKINI